MMPIEFIVWESVNIFDWEPMGLERRALVREDFGWVNLAFGLWV